MPVPFQDRGHGRSMDRIAMTFFCWCVGLSGDFRNRHGSVFRVAHHFGPGPRRATQPQLDATIFSGFFSHFQTGEDPFLG